MASATAYPYASVLMYAYTGRNRTRSVRALSSIKSKYRGANLCTVGIEERLFVVQLNSFAI